nr:transmembrane 7 superfamily member 3-like [Procambarus clarkii]
MRSQGRILGYWLCLCLFFSVPAGSSSEKVSVERGKTEGTNIGDNTQNRTWCEASSGKVAIQERDYSVKNVSYEIFGMGQYTSIAVKIMDIDEENVSFLIVQAHSQSRYLLLGHELNPVPGTYINSTSPGLVVHVDNSFSHSQKNGTHRVFLTNCHDRNITVLFIVRNYSNSEPIPGNYKAPYNLTQPYLAMEPNILTTKVTYRAASYPDLEPSPTEGQLKYETFLTYMYERDLSEKKYWNALIATSTLKGLREHAKSVAREENNNTSEELNKWFVSYSGVGAVITVVVSCNNSQGALYSSAVSYGCDFIDAVQYECTKLVTPLAKLFCASLLFIGGILLFLGHRWLNFTMFTSGFLFFWCVFFLMCAQDTSSSITALGWGTLVGAIAGGTLWLVGWHKFQRPFHSSLLIIVITVIFVGMVVTHFLRYAIAPKSTNLSAFVVFPVFFAILIIAYAIVDIKKVHIFSCVMLGSYAFIVPFAFYFGSSLTYIVINVIGLMTVENYSEAVGYPPFQVCDIILLCLWILLFISGMGYQLYRERSSPPFQPPNLSSWRATKKFCNFVFDKIFACLPMDPDPGGVGIEDRPTWILRITYSFRMLRERVTCNRHNSLESGYESFQRVRTTSHSPDEELNSNASKFNAIKARINEWIDKVRSRLRRDDERLLEDSDDDDTQFEGDGVACCSFRKSRVVLDDEYTANSH